MEHYYASTDHSAAIADKPQSFPKVISEVIQKDLTNKINGISLSIDWDIPGFTKQECLNGQPLGSLIILTTNGVHAQATTCKEYLSWRWPHLSSLLMVTLEKTVNERGGIIDGELKEKGLFLELSYLADAFSSFCRTERFHKLEFLPKPYNRTCQRHRSIIRIDRGSGRLHRSFSLADRGNAKVFI